MPKPSLQTYSEKHVQDAVIAVRNGMQIRKASQTYGVPRSTLRRRLKAGPSGKTTMGPSPFLAHQEAAIAEWMSLCAQKGFSISKEDVMCSVQEFLNENPLEKPHPFKNNCPGEKWYKSFLKRHPTATKKTPEPCSSTMATTETDIKKWFVDIEAYLRNNNLFDILNDPRRVLNADVTDFHLCPKTGKVLAAKRARNLHTSEQGPNKDTITVMFTFSASGGITPPMIVYPYQRIPKEVFASVPETWGVGRSDTGCMKGHVFCDYLTNNIKPDIEAKDVPKPVIMFIDGRKTPVTYQVSQLCSRLGIELIALYPDAVRLLQPTDAVAFRPVKEGWRQAVREWKRDHPTESLTKIVFAPILEMAINKCMDVKGFQCGFAAVGVCPWNQSAVDYGRCPVKPAFANPNVEESECATAITKRDFEAIVGKEIIEKFANMDETTLELEAGNECFVILLRLWEHFHKCDAKKPEQNGCNSQRTTPSSNLNCKVMNVAGESTNAHNSFQDFADLNVGAVGYVKDQATVADIIFEGNSILSMDIGGTKCVQIVPTCETPSFVNSSNVSSLPSNISYETLIQVAGAVDIQ